MVMMILLAGCIEASLFNLNVAQKLVQTKLYRSDKDSRARNILPICKDNSLN